MRHPFRITAALAAMLIGMAPGLAAQARRGLVELPPEGTRQGFWLSGGFGFGKESYRFGSDPFVDNAEKPVFAIRLGGTPNRNLRLGGELTTFVNPTTTVDGYNVTETLSSMTVVGLFYPARNAGFFLKGGAGIGVSASSLEFSNTITETGFVVQFGAGYDIALSRSLALTPTVELFRHRYTESGDDTLHERLFHFGLALTWQK